MYHHSSGSLVFVCFVLLAILPGALSASFETLRISEIRIDQPSTDLDEYFELVGPPGASLDGLTYVVIGDGSGGSGVIEAIVALDGLAMPADGYFVAAEASFTLGPVDLTTVLDFENGDNVTHLLVEGFTGSDNQDLDTDDDGILDVLPWITVVDRIALIEEDNPPTGTEFHYGPPTVGPDGSTVPEHAIFCLQGWIIGDETLGVDDTPGAFGCCLTLDCYYGGIDLSSRSTTRATLHEAIDDHTRIAYDGDASWEILELADEWPRESATILDVYRNGLGEKVTGRGSIFEREHTWPQSYGFPNDTGTGRYPRSDYHAIFLADASYNGSRSNVPFATCIGCDERPTESNNGQGGEGGPYPGDSNWRMGTGTTGTWEVWTGARGGRRGDIARALFYMDVRYDGSDHQDGSAEPDLVLTSDRGLLFSDSTNPQDPAYMGILSELLLWHEQDPVDDLETWRQEVIFVAQGNRNPFIDHPGLARCVFLEDCGVFADGFESGDTSAWSGSQG